jgi:hypothetical protein
MNIIETLRERYRLDPTVQQAADEIERLRDALHDIQDMPEDWELDEEMTLLFVIDNHIRLAKEALEGK